MCRQCGTNGRALSRSKWYRRNSGWKKAQLPRLSNDEITLVMGLRVPSSSGTNARKRNFEEIEEIEASVSKRVAGSCVVRVRLDQARYMRLECPILTNVHQQGPGCLFSLQSLQAPSRSLQKGSGCFSHFFATSSAGVSLPTPDTVQAFTVAT